MAGPIGQNAPVTYSDNEGTIRGAQEYGAQWRATQEGPIESWYAAGLTTHIITGSITTLAVTVDKLVAVPFYGSRLGAIDGMAFEVTTPGAAGSVARIGIYRATSLKNVYPGELVWDSGSIATDAGTVKATTGLAIRTYPRNLYWFCYVSGVADPTVRAISSTAVPLYDIWGFPATLGAGPGRPGLFIAFPFAALPAQFPAGATPSTSQTFPVIAARFAY